MDKNINNDLDQEVVYVDFEPKGSNKVVEHNAIRSGAPTISAISRGWKKIKTKLFGTSQEKANLVREKIDNISKGIVDKKEEAAEIKNDMNNLEKTHDTLIRFAKDPLSIATEEKINSLEQDKKMDMIRSKIEFEQAKIDLNKFRSDLFDAKTLLAKYNKKILKIQIRDAKYEARTGKEILRAASGRKITSNFTKGIFASVWYGGNRNEWPEHLRPAYDNIQNNHPFLRNLLHGKMPEQTVVENKDVQSLEQKLSNDVNHIMGNDKPEVKTVKEENGLNRVENKPLETEKNDMSVGESLNSQLTDMVAQLRKEQEEKAKNAEPVKQVVTPVVEPVKEAEKVATPEAKKEDATVKSDAVDFSKASEIIRVTTEKLANYDKMAANAKELERKNSALESKNQELTQANTTKEAKLVESERRASDAESKWASASMTLDKVNSEKTGLEKVLVNKEKEIASRDVELDKVRNENAQMTRKLDENTVAMNKMNEMLERLEKQNAELQAKYEKERSEKESIAKQATNMLNEFAKLTNVVQPQNVEQPQTGRTL